MADHDGGSGAPPAGDPRLKLAYDEAVRSASLMHEVRAGLRARAGTLVSTTGIATAFLGGLALVPGDASAWVWLALAAFVGSALFSILVLRERELPVAFDAQILLDHYVYASRPRSLDDMYLELTQYLEAGVRESRRRVGHLFKDFYAAAALLVVELLFWVAALVDRE